MKKYSKDFKLIAVADILKRTVSRLIATAPNQVWSWDITYLTGPIKGLYYYLNIFSRDIMAWKV